jgi:hypothetical protein
MQRDLTAAAGRKYDMSRALLIAAAALVFPTGLPASESQSAQREQGTVKYSWNLLWPQADQHRAYLRKFRTRGGLIRTVRVIIGGKIVRGAPYVSGISSVGCKTRHVATAQRAWLWDGHNVYVSLLLEPGRCAVAGKPTRATIVLRTVGT